MTDLERVARAIRAGCMTFWEGHLVACSYPDCSCRVVPLALRAALDAMTEPPAGFFGDRGG